MAKAARGRDLSKDLFIADGQTIEWSGGKRSYNFMDLSGHSTFRMDTAVLNVANAFWCSDGSYAVFNNSIIRPSILSVSDSAVVRFERGELTGSTSATGMVYASDSGLIDMRD